MGFAEELQILSWKDVRKTSNKVNLASRASNSVFYMRVHVQVSFRADGMQF